MEAHTLRQPPPTLDHLLISCVFSRQVWFNILQRLGLQAVAPQPEDHSFESWWDQASRRVADQARKGLNSAIILVAWSLWIHRNRCDFDGLLPSLPGILASIKDELHTWELGGGWLEGYLISSPYCPMVNLLGHISQGL
ncbi:hypothetical protein HU200_053520 [Digitaria exilis]|uniref:Reverse transcriptase zinc-binding domain-containing protein n=1 Tax=Digitaria exilis TaxID=1010633 RepID=A0A835ARS8_9POAL|nr:hypothetical protein HU200_053520 [Digitaria exilis]